MTEDVIISKTGQHERQSVTFLNAKAIMLPCFNIEKILFDELQRQHTTQTPFSEIALDPIFR